MQPRRQTKAILVEALLVAGVGLIVSLLANALSPLGLRLGRNYFPASERPSPSGASAGSATAEGITNAASANVAGPLLSRLQQQGLQAISSNEVIRLFRDPTYEQGLVAFVDARNDRNYQAGHIPGAWQFDHYRAEQYLPAVLPACLAAQKVVVYCSGGTCEDSEFAALILRDAGVPKEGLFVYAGGISEWTTNGLPVEVGPRGSGQMLNPGR